MATGTDKGKHLVICGTPRSGTTLLHNMMWYTLGHDFHFHGKETRASTVVGCFRNQVTKRPVDVREVLALREQHPEVIPIIVLRDPRCVMVSFHAHAPNQFKMGWKTCLKTGSKKGVTHLGDGLKYYIDALIEVLNEIIPGCILVKYERMVRRPWMVQTHLGEALDLNFRGRFQDWHKGTYPHRMKLQLNGQRPTNTDRISSWKEYPERIIYLMNKHPEIQEYLVRFGYVSDESWIKEAENLITS